jgi:hypothetical protein
MKSSTSALESTEIPRYENETNEIQKKISCRFLSNSQVDAKNWYFSLPMSKTRDQRVVSCHWHKRSLVMPISIMNK